MKTDNICRLCASKSDNFLNIFAGNNGETLSKVGELMLDCLFSEIPTRDLGYPEIVCQYCNLQLNVFYEFKKKVFENHKHFTEQIKFDCQNEEVNVNPQKVDEFSSDELEENIRNKIEAEFEESTLIPEPDPAPQSIPGTEQASISDSESDNRTKMIIKIEHEDESENTTFKMYYLSDEEQYDDEMYLDEEYINEDSESELVNDQQKVLKKEEAEEEEEHEQEECTYEIMELESEINACKSPTLQIDALDDCAQLKKRKTGKPIEYQNRKCPHCSRTFSSKTSYIKHVRSHGIKVICDICDKPTYNLDEHKKLHEDKFHCSICGKKFGSMFSCVNHERRHSEIRSYQCQACEKRFKLPSDLYNHMLCHNDVRKHVCTECGKAFRMNSHLTNHMESHNLTNIFQCSFCDMTLKTSKTLRSHILQVHSTDHQYKCLYCQKGFMNKYKWKRHMNNVHSDEHKNKFDDEV